MKRIVWLATILSAVAILLSACSSGGGGTAANPAASTISGVAAAGAPIIGFAYLKDSQNNELGPTTIAADGSFLFDLTKMPAGSSAPYYLQAQGATGGQSFVLHSIVGSAGTANINPLTNLVVAQATGGMDPSAVFSNTKNVGNVTQSSIDAAITAMRTSLAPLLTAAGVNATTMNPVTDSYVANPATNKLDALFDAVTITVAPPTSSGTAATVAVMDKSGNSILPSTAVTTAPATIATSVTATTTVTQTMTDSQAITTFLQGFGTTINSKGANLLTSDLTPYYYGTDSTYGLDNGYTRTQTLQDLVSNLTGKVLQARGQITKMANFAIVNDVTTNATYQNKFNKVYRIKADFYFSDGSYGSPNSMTVVQATQGGAWQFIGNGHIADVEITPYANQVALANNTVSYKTGLYIYLEDVGNLGVNSASLEGPGLPTGGVTFSKTATGNGSNTRLALDPSFMGFQQGGDSWGQLEMSDTQIGQMVTGITGYKQYILKLYSTTTVPSDHATGLMQTLNPIMSAAPITNANFTVTASNTSAIVATWFPTATISNLTHSMSSLATMVMSMTSIPFTYTKPTAYNPAWLSASVDIWDNSTNNQYTNMELALNATSSSMTIVKPTGWTPTNGYLTMEAQDSARRYFRTIWVLQ